MARIVRVHDSRRRAHLRDRGEAFRTRPLSGGVTRRPGTRAGRTRRVGHVGRGH